MGANNRLTNDLLQEKPQDCRADCGGRVPAPPPEMPTARMTYRCGLCEFPESLTRYIGKIDKVIDHDFQGL